MFSFKFFCLEMVIEFGLFSLHDPHKLINLEPESIEVGAIHSMERVVHYILKDIVDSVFIIGQLEDILT